MNINKYLGIWLLAIIMQFVTCLNADDASISGFPIAAYSHETRLMGGGFLNYLKQTEKDSLATELQITSLLIYTARKQFQILSIPRLKLNNEKYLLGMEIRGRNWPDKYYGIGNTTNELNYEKITQRQLKLGLDGEIRLYKSLYAGAKLAFIDENIKKGNRENLPYAENFHGINGTQTYYGIGAGMRYKAIDNDQYPSKGVNYTVAYMQYHAAKQEAGKQKFGQLQVELNHYLPAVPGAVLAMQSSFTRSENKLPYSFLPELGNKLRAYDSKRYVDNVLIAQRAELRVFPSELPLTDDIGLLQKGFFRRMGFVAFYEAGQVAQAEKDISWERNHYSAGFGIRYSVSVLPRINLRADFAFGGGGMNVIVQGGEVF
ncbi:MAG: hypothetical protein PHY48_09795 [Candidatus Cloacimonetes bacterium]|nr:hypothetical protein [Candidatus Cloacimonadota bacterium]